jgi:hypothetical protein
VGTKQRSKSAESDQWGVRPKPDWRNLGGDGYVGGRTISGDGDRDGIQLQRGTRRGNWQLRNSIILYGVLLLWWIGGGVQQNREIARRKTMRIQICAAIMFAN